MPVVPVPTAHVSDVENVVSQSDPSDSVPLAVVSQVAPQTSVLECQVCDSAGARGTAAASRTTPLLVQCFRGTSWLGWSARDHQTEHSLRWFKIGILEPFLRHVRNWKPH